MIGTIDIKLNAANPQVPLDALHTFVGSPSQVRVINAPKAIGAWKLTRVFVTANYPDNSSQSVEAVLTGGCWHATIPAPTVAGKSLLGFKVTANGVKDDGTTAVTGYVLGCGDVVVLDTDSTVVVGGVTYYIHLLDLTPSNPKKGDFALDTMKLWNGSAWVSLGGGGGDVTHAEFADMSADLDLDESSMGDIMTKVNTLITKLKGTTAAVVAIIAFSLLGAVDVQKAKLSTLPGKTMVVTNVTGAASADELYSATNATLAAAKADAAGKYMTFDGGTIRGMISAGNGQWISSEDFCRTAFSLGNYFTSDPIYATRSKYFSLTGDSGCDGPAAGVVFWGETSDSSSARAKMSFAISNYGTLRCQSDFVPDGTPVLTANLATNDFPIVTNAYTKTEVDALTDYALTNLVGTSIALASGQIGNVTLSNVQTNLALSLDFSASPDRSGDCMLLAFCGAETTLAVGPSQAVDILGSYDKLKAGTNLVAVTRMMMSGTNSVVMVNVKEVK